MLLLDSQEITILFKVAAGKTYDVIGRELSPPLKGKTVTAKMVTIIRKLGARDRTNAVVIALLAGCFTEKQLLQLANSRLPVYRVVA